MPETERRSSHRHNRRHRRRSSSSSKSKTKLRLIDYFLMLWSAVSLVAFFYLIDKVESAPVWQVVGLAVSTLVGLILFFKLAMRTKK
ncbi:MAG: hypothetical protein JWP88_449 [Flaviaesturariibacter sp.]|nr:hypothetical protein [Flaviaesturariibacter sp.]